MATRIVKTLERKRSKRLYMGQHTCCWRCQWPNGRQSEVPGSLILCYLPPQSQETNLQMAWLGHSHPCDVIIQLIAKALDNAFLSLVGTSPSIHKDEKYSGLWHFLPSASGGILFLIEEERINNEPISQDKSILESFSRRSITSHLSLRTAPQSSLR